MTRYIKKGDKYMSPRNTNKTVKAAKITVKCPICTRIYTIKNPHRNIHHDKNHTLYVGVSGSIIGCKYCHSKILKII